MKWKGCRRQQPYTNSPIYLNHCCTKHPFLKYKVRKEQHSYRLPCVNKTQTKPFAKWPKVHLHARYCTYNNSSSLFQTFISRLGLKRRFTSELLFIPGSKPSWNWVGERIYTCLCIQRGGNPRNLGVFSAMLFSRTSKVSESLFAWNSPV